MDEFLKDINTIIFKQWILNQKIKKSEIVLDGIHNNIIIIKNNNSYSQIIFNDMNIIELCVTNISNNKMEFYLHFQMTTLKHAVELYNEMLESIYKLHEVPTIKILLSCSGGLTTAYFAQKMNEVADFLHLNYHADAIGYNGLFNIGEEYDVILLAPQISYMHAKVQEILKDQIVLKVPSIIFAKYDVGKIFPLINEAINKHNQEVTELNTHISLKKAEYTNQKILCIAVIRNSERVHIAYRLYDEKNRILLDYEIIKLRMSTYDLFDIIDTVLLQHPDIVTIGLSIPGIINDGYITSTHLPGLKNVDLTKFFKEKYTQKLVISNDVNATAIGYYASQEKYSTLSFLFQPIAAYSGVGNIVDGKLITGRYNIAGEIQYLPLDLSDNKLVINKTPEGAIELAAKTIVSLISILDPEAIILCCVLIPEVEDLKKEIEKHLPKSYIPEIIKIEHIQEYILLGQMLLCAKKNKGE